jgi:IgA Peptidase M64/von Willebrand factor type A domain
MGASDGHIIGKQKVVDHGPAANRWNLVILAEGYQFGEMNKFHDDVRNVIDGFYSTPPYDQVWCGINVYRVDVASNDSGADDPAACGGTGATAATYFDASFCNSGARRLLLCDSTLAQNVAAAQVPEVHRVLVLVNSPIYGGGGGSVATCSTNPSASEIAIHEIGHSEFGFADEYAYYLGCGVDVDKNNYPGLEPGQPNITANTDIATNKWKDLIALGTAMPTMTNPDCTLCPSGASPVAAGTVGTFEGAGYYHCGLYRPEYQCKMQMLGVPFCVVCQRVIKNHLTPFMAPDTLNLDTPSISFANIPEGLGGVGVTTYRAIVFEVASCTSVTLEITAGPTGGFGTPLGTSIIVPPSEFGPVSIGRIWISYVSTHAGDTASGSVTVHCPETGQTWIIPITANTVARPKAEVSMVFDHSGSMIESAGGGMTKVQKLREAANIFVDLMLPGDGVGLVRFDDTAQIIMSVTDVGVETTGPGRVAAHSTINSSQLDPAGNTSIGAGVQQGKANLDAGQLAAGSHPYDVLGMIVLTDGEENTAPWLSMVGPSITANTYTVGLGTADNISTDALNTLTQNHHGYLLITGTLTTDQSFLLQKYFLQLLAGVTNANVVLDPQGFVVYGADWQKIPFTVTEADYGMDAIILTPEPQLLEFALETPDGTVISPATVGSNVKFITESKVSYYRISLPALPIDATGSHSGTWYALLKFGKRGDRKIESVFSQAQQLPYSLVIHSYSSLNFKANLTQDSHYPGSPVNLTATLKEYDVPVDHRATMWADITRPDGSSASLSFQETDPGQFEATYNKTSLIGLYTFRIRAKGTTFSDTPFTRELTLTAGIFRGDENTAGNPDTQVIIDWLREKDKKLCLLLECLLSEKTLSPQFVEELKRKGLNLQAIRECLVGYCHHPTKN